MLRLGAWASRYHLQNYTANSLGLHITEGLGQRQSLGAEAEKPSWDIPPWLRRPTTMGRSIQSLGAVCWVHVRNLNEVPLFITRSCRLSSHSLVDKPNWVYWGVCDTIVALDIGKGVEAPTAECRDFQAPQVARASWKGDAQNSKRRRGEQQVAAQLNLLLVEGSFLDKPTLLKSTWTLLEGAVQRIIVVSLGLSPP